jgi:acetyl esterase/lipase
MTFTLDTEVAEVLAAEIARSGLPPSPPVGDVASRRVALDAMLGYFNNEAQPVADKVDISDHSVVTPGGATLLARWYRRPSGDSRAAVLYLHGGGLAAGVAILSRDRKGPAVARQLPACRTSTTPSPSTPTCRAVRKATATACCGACDASRRGPAAGSGGSTRIRPSR